MEHSVNNWESIVLPQTFEELEQVPLNRPYNFLMSLDKDSIDKEGARIGTGVHMFWELPKVRDALNDLCKKWFYNDSKAYIQWFYILQPLLKPIQLLHHPRLRLFWANL